MEQWEKATDAAKRLKINRYTLWRWIRDERITHKRMGRSFFVASSEIDQLAQFGTTQKPRTK